MKTKPYEKYKEIELPWLERIPSHWDQIRNKNLLVIKDDRVGLEHGEYTLLSLTKKGIIKRDMENPQGKFPKEFDTYKIVSKNDIIFCLFDIDETPRTLGLSEFEGMITGAYDIFSIENINRRYYYYYYLNLDNFKMMKPLYTGLRKTININRFMRLLTPLPPKEEQDKIVAFLDNKLEKIDKFIDLKARQIELLKEQKEAMIDKAVTEGIDNRTEMKRVELPWLNQIPKHWELVRNKSLITVMEETVDYDFKDYDLLSLTKKGIIKRDMENPKGKFPNSFENYKIVEKDDIIFCLFDIDETPRTVGLSNLDGMITGAYNIFSLKNINKDYFYYYYLSLDNKKALKPLYSSLRKTIRQNTFLRITTPKPSREEQKKIVNHIKKESKIINKTINLYQKEINLIKEYRTSLISSLVTGKIDIREFEGI